MRMSPFARDGCGCVFRSFERRTINDGNGLSRRWELLIHEQGIAAAGIVVSYLADFLKAEFAVKHDGAGVAGAHHQFHRRNADSHELLQRVTEQRVSGTGAPVGRVHGNRDYLGAIGLGSDDDIAGDAAAAFGNEKPLWAPSVVMTEEVLAVRFLGKASRFDFEEARKLGKPEGLNFHRTTHRASRVAGQTEKTRKTGTEPPFCNRGNTTVRTKSRLRPGFCMMERKEISMKVTNVVLAGLLLALLVPVTAGEEIDGRSQGQLLRKPYVSTVTGAERDYFLFVPKGYETEEGKLWPVILFLHGGGERGDGKADLDKLLKHGPIKEASVNGRDLPFLIISPQMPSTDEATRKKLAESRARRPARPRGRTPMAREITGQAPRWDEHGPPLGWSVYEKDVLNMVDDTLRDYRADPDRVYVTGLSYGGFGTWHFAGAYPERWAAVAPICGAGNPNSIPNIAEAKLPIWIFAGGRDTTVLPEWVLASAVALEKAGHPDVRFTVHEDRPHDTWTRVYEGWDLYNWFLKHRR